MTKLYAIVQPNIDHYLPLAVKRNFQAACEFTRTLYMAMNPGKPFQERIGSGHFAIGDVDLRLGQYYDLVVREFDVDEVDQSKSLLFVQFGYSKSEFESYIFSGLTQAEQAKEAHPDLRVSTYLVDFIEREQKLLTDAITHT